MKSSIQLMMSLKSFKKSGPVLVWSKAGCLYFGLETVVSYCFVAIGEYHKLMIGKVHLQANLKGKNKEVAPPSLDEAVQDLLRNSNTTKIRSPSIYLS